MHGVATTIADVAADLGLDEGDIDVVLEQTQRRLAQAEAKLRRHQAATEAGIDPAALVDAINQSHAERTAAQAELNERPAAQELTRQDIETMIDSIADMAQH